jgi:transposase
MSPTRGLPNYNNMMRHRMNGRKRHLLVDTQGFVLTHTLRLYGPDLPRLSRVWADAGYSGHPGGDLRLPMGWTLEVVKRSGAQPRSAFAVQLRRWIVERTFGW